MQSKYWATIRFRAGKPGLEVMEDEGRPEYDGPFDAQGLRLLRVFARIRDRERRSKVIELVEMRTVDPSGMTSKTPKSGARETS